MDIIAYRPAVFQLSFPAFPCRLLHPGQKQDMIQISLITLLSVEESGMFIADLHIHSHYSRATSRDCTPAFLDLWARKKGITLLGTGDFTHPAWRAELKEKLLPAEEGLYLLREEFRLPCGTAGVPSDPRFLITGEISSIYKRNGRTRKVHNLILLPSIEAAEVLSRRLEAIGNLHSDGRPILGLDSRDLLEITLDVCPDAMLIPAHIWTPHFSMFGAFSGFDTVEECFGDLAPEIHAFETGLSSDPPMNWRLSALDRYVMVSNSDAHSPQKLGREANLFKTDCSYPAVRRALQGEDPQGLSGTIEFFPEEGKYHYDGHRNCKVCLTPTETVQAGGVCPVCGGRLTVGVLHRVEALADRPEGTVPAGARPYENLVPLPEVIAASTGFTPASTKVQACYEHLLQTLGPEFSILRELPLSEIAQAAGPCVAEGIRRMRAGEIEMAPGYDGEYGKLQLLDPAEISRISGQLSLFGAAVPQKTKKEPRPAPVLKPEKKTQLQKAADPAPSETAAALSGLNPEQREAVCAQDPCVMVIAGPGTGKTKTLVARICHLLASGVRPETITAVTFTNKAAREMQDRLFRTIGNRRTVKAMTIGTFHSICLRLLSEAGRAGVLLSEHDAECFAEETIAAFSLSLAPKQFLSGISRIKSGGIPEGKAESLLTPAVCTDYQARLQNANAMDFDDLLLKVLEEKESPGSCTARFSHLLVDEFQDINSIQYRLIRKWSQTCSGLFVIGDPDQSIYGFRGSDAGCFERLQEAFPDARRITLVRNYRSSPAILRCASAAIAQNRRNDRIPLQPVCPEGPAVRLLTASDAFSEALFLAKEINRMVGGIDMLDAQSHGAGGARGFSEIACLYRTHRQAELLEKCFQKEGIPYTVTGRDTLLADPQVRGAAAFFRALLYPEDRAALHTALFDAFHCPPEVVKAADSGKADLCSIPQWGFLSEKYRPLLKKSRPHTLLDQWMADTGHAGSEPLEKLRNIAVLSKSMPDFLQNLTLGTESDLTRSSSKTYRSDAVSLMTLHAAKGLEFPVVFLCGMQKDLLPLSQPGRVSDPAEERRLFYVGMTRAKEELVLLTSPSPSPFLSEIPDALFQHGCTTEGSRAHKGTQLRFF